MQNRRLKSLAMEDCRHCGGARVAVQGGPGNGVPAELMVSMSAMEDCGTCSV